MNRLVKKLCLLFVWLIAADAWPHGGRRFEVVVEDGRLAAHGYISTGVDDDGGVVRPYRGALHDHWNNSESFAIATAGLPGFDVFDSEGSYVDAGSAAALEGGVLTLTLLDAAAWRSPSPPALGLVPQLDDLAADELIAIESELAATDTGAPGAIGLTRRIGAGGATDLDLNFAIGEQPSGVLHVLRWRLSTDAAGVADSADVYTILAPDRSVGGLHHQSLFLERYLGEPLAAGDLTRDGAVDANDYAAWAASFGAAHRFAGAGTDADRNGVTGAGDYVLWRDSLRGAAAASGRAVPEPAGVALVGLGALALLSRGRLNLAGAMFPSG